MPIIAQNVGAQGVGNEELLHNSTSQVRHAQGFQVTEDATLTKARVRMYRQGSPSGDFWIEVRSDSGGNPSSTVLATSSLIDASTVSTGTTPATVYEVTFTGGPALVTGTQYHLVFQADYALSGVNCLIMEGAATGDTYADGSAKRQNSVDAWSSANTVADFYFEVEGSTSNLFEYEAEGGARGQGAAEPEATWNVTPAGGSEGAGVGEPGITVNPPVAGGGRSSGEARLSSRIAVDIILYEPAPNPYDIILRDNAAPTIVEYTGIGGARASGAATIEFIPTGTVVVPVPLLPINIPGGGSWFWEKTTPKPKRHKRVFITPRRGKAVLVSVAGQTRGYGRIDVSRLIERDLAMLDALDALDQIGAR